MSFVNIAIFVLLTQKITADPNAERVMKGVEFNEVLVHILLLLLKLTQVFLFPFFTER